MKTSIKLFFVILAVAVSVTGYAQKKAKPFKGVVTYGITYEGDEIDAATQAQLPTGVIVSILGNKVRNEQVSAFYSMASISNMDDGSAIILIDAMGMKIGVNQSKEDIDGNIEEASLEDPVVTLLDETKEIAGYTCKKAEVSNGDDIIEVYYTDEINVPTGMNDNNGFKGINGLLMEYSVVQEGMIMIMTVKEVKKGKVNKGMFVIPDDYEIKTMDELGGMFGG
jgi:GLPGLI family protein